LLIIKLKSKNVIIWNKNFNAVNNSYKVVIRKEEQCREKPIYWYWEM
jgi:hypothetical protein